jgi:hypothetical protein
MIHQNQGNPQPGAARGREGGPAPNTGAQKQLVRIDDRNVPDLLKEILSRGAVVVDFTHEGLPVIQIYDRKMGRHRRFTWRLVDGWLIDMFEVV